MSAVTVTRKGPPKPDAITRARYVLAFSKLPGQEFGPYSFAEASGQLRVAALLSVVDARELLFDACLQGSATREVAGGITASSPEHLDERGEELAREERADCSS